MQSSEIKDDIMSSNIFSVILPVPDSKDPMCTETADELYYAVTEQCII
jgi:hypothetical protein